MKAKWIIIILLILGGLTLMLIGNHELMSYEIQEGQETLREAWKAARSEFWGWYIGGIVLMIPAYILTYVPEKK